MTTTPQTRFESRMKTAKRAYEAGEISDEDWEAITDFITAYHPEKLIERPPDGEKTLSIGSCEVYLSRLTTAAKQFTLVDATTEDVNGFLQWMLDDGRGTQTINGYASTFRKFYDLLDVNVDPSALSTVKESNGSAFDPDDILTREEIDAIMQAADHPRDRAVFALLIYTGMRSHALRTLRIKDVDVQEGRWQFNPEHTEGLKGADKRGQKRPLLDAKGPVRDWISYHPHGDNRDAYLISAHPKYGDPDPDTPLGGSAIRRIMSKLAENTDDPEIERKPTHPHMMRHNFVTICKRDYEMDEATIKHLLGHVKGSQIFETTYSHLSDEDFNQKAEVAAGHRDPDAEGSTFTPRSCSVCAEPLPAGAKACASCGNPVTPDAVSVQAQMSDDVKKDYRDTEPSDEETVDELDTLDEILDDPEVKALIAEKLADA